MNILETRGLTKYYGETRGIESMDLSVEKGSFFGFIGPNGAGKSTAIRTLLGLIYPSSGEAFLFGKHFQKERLEILRRVGYLPAEVNLYGNLTGEAMLRYSGRFYGMVDEKRMKDLATWFDFDISRQVEELSFGNKKKMGIILALLHKPEMVIMDEPTGGLDPLMQARFFEWLKDENEKGLTVFFSSHTLNEVQKHCRQVAVIKEGRILEVSDIETLRGKQLKKVRIHLRHQNEGTEGLSVNGIYRFESEKLERRFDFDGDFGELFSKLSSWPIEAFTMEEPSLEEIFMHYYRDGGEKHE
jgi:ABC-2 type transport system ATP-binding protein